MAHPLRLLYPYNEILPKRKAHDLFLYHECTALSLAGISTTLLVGSGSLNQHELARYYNAPSSPLNLATLSLIRKNNPLNLSWNWPFFALSDRFLKNNGFNAVVFSVLKQAHYSLRKKAPAIRYIYEVHELNSYPTQDFKKDKTCQLEYEVLNRCDLITVTTDALKSILLEPPYCIKTPIVTVNLASHVEPLPTVGKWDQRLPLTLAYIGQLYAEQGVGRLIEALAQTENIRLKIIGGRPQEIAALKEWAAKWDVKDRVVFTGFLPQHEILKWLDDVQGFVAPFEPVGRMPFVAHTKLYEYARFGRPIIAPDLPIVKEHLKGGVLHFEAASTPAIAKAMQLFCDNSIREKLQSEIQHYIHAFSWSERAQQLIEAIDLLRN